MARVGVLMTRIMLQPIQEVSLVLVCKARVGVVTAGNYRVEIPWVFRLMVQTLGAGRPNMTRTSVPMPKVGYLHPNLNQTVLTKISRRLKRPRDYFCCDCECNCSAPQAPQQGPGELRRVGSTSQTSTHQLTVHIYL